MTDESHSERLNFPDGPIRDLLKRDVDSMPTMTRAEFVAQLQAHVREQPIKFITGAGT